MDGATDGRGLVILVDGGREPMTWSSWSGVLDADGYDTVTVRRPAGASHQAFPVLLRQAGTAVRAMSRPPVLIGHGRGAAAVLRLREQEGVAAVVAVAPIRICAKPWPRPRRAVRGAVPPLLLVSGGRDVVSRETFVERLERRARRRYPDAVSDHQVFPTHGHELVTGPGWEDVAGFILDWLSRQNL